MSPEDPAADRLERRLAALAIALALAVLLAPALLPAVQFAGRDSGRLCYPLKHFVTDELAHGRLPVWNPYNALGEPLLASIVSGPLDPLNALGVALPFGAGFKAMYLACYLLAAVGGYLWLRRRALSPAAAAAGALSFTLSGYLTGVANNLIFLRGIALVPLFFFALEAALKRGGALRCAAAAVAWALLLYGGDPETWLLALPLGLALMLLDPCEKGQRRAYLGRVLGVLALGALFSAPMLLPVALDFPRTDRALLGPIAAPAWWLGPRQWGELVAPHLAGDLAPTSSFAGLATGRGAPWVPSEYLGCLSLALAVPGALVRRGRGPLVLLVFALWLAAGPVLGATPVGSLIPIWTSFQYSEKLIGFVALFLAPLAALGVDLLRDPRGSRRFLYALIVALLVSGVIAILSLTKIPESEAHRSFAGAAHQLPFAVAAAVMVRILRKRGMALAFGLTILVAADLLVANRLEPALLPPDVVEAKGPLGEWMRVHDPLGRVSTPFEIAAGESPKLETVFRRWSRTLVPLWNVEARVGNLGWYGALAGGRYREVRERGKEGFRYLGAAAALGAGYLVVPGTLDNLRLVGIDPQGVEVEASEPSVPAWLVGLPHRRFAYLAERVELASSEAALAAVLQPGFASSGRTVIEGSFPALTECPVRPAASECSEPTRCTIRVDAACPGALVVNIPPLPGWTFAVDEREAEPAPANFLASAIPVPAGEHVVTLRYRAPGLAEGFVLAVVAALATLYLWRRERRNAPA